MKKGIFLIVALSLVFSLSIPSFAAEVKSATITYREIKVLLDGRQINPTDVNGTSTEPFIMNNSTFLPVRAIAGALGLDVSWDNDTSTVYLNSGTTPTFYPGTPTTSNAKKNVSITYRNIKIVIDGKVINPTDVSGNTVEPFLLNGTTYLPVRAVSGALGLYVDWDNDSNTVILNSSSDKPTISNKDYADFVKGYEKAVFSKFNSPASENGLGGTKIYFECRLDSIEFIDNWDTFSIIGTVTDTGGNKWGIIMHATPFVTGDYFDPLIGKSILLRAEYGGYSSVKKMPSASLDALIDLETGDIVPGILRYGDLPYDAIRIAYRIPYSAFGTTVSLMNEMGYSRYDSERAVANSGIDWNKQAKRAAENIAQTDYPASRDYIRESLLNVWVFEPSEVEYALSQACIDWKFQAAGYAYHSLSGDITPKDVEYTLNEVGFTAEEISYAIENCGHDWYSYALNTTSHIYNYYGGSLSKNDIYSYLIGQGFTDSQATYAINNYGMYSSHTVETYISDVLFGQNTVWYTWCDNCTEIYGQYSRCPICGAQTRIQGTYGYTKQETVSELLKAGFTSSEINQALVNYHDNYFYNESKYIKP